MRAVGVGIGFHGEFGRRKLIEFSSPLLDDMVFPPYFELFFFGYGFPPWFRFSLSLLILCNFRTL